MPHWLLNRMPVFAPEGTESGGTTTPTTTAASHPEPQTFSLDYVRELRAENKRYRLAMMEHEKTATDAKAAAEAAAKALKDAEGKFTKDLEAKIAETNGAAQARLVRAELKAHAVKAGMIDMDGLKLLDTSAIKVGDDGEVVVPEDFFEKAKAAKPYLFQQTGAERGTTTHTAAPPPARQPGTTKKVAEMTDAERKAARERISRGILD